MMPVQRFYFTGLQRTVQQEFYNSPLYCQLVEEQRQQAARIAQALASTHAHSPKEAAQLARVAMALQDNDALMHAEPSEAVQQRAANAQPSNFYEASEAARLHSYTGGSALQEHTAFYHLAYDWGQVFSGAFHSTGVFAIRYAQDMLILAMVFFQCGWPFCTFARALLKSSKLDAFS